MLYGALETEPGCKRNTAHKLFWNPREIERNQAEAAALKDEVSGFEDLLEAALVIVASSLELVGRRLSVLGKGFLVRRSSYVVRKIKIATQRKPCWAGKPASLVAGRRGTAGDRGQPTSHPKQLA